MILTKLELNLRHPGARQCMRDCHDMHRTVMSAFGEAPRARAGVLYRVQPKTGGAAVYIVSAKEPDLPRLEKNGFVSGRTINMDALQKVFLEGACMRFDLLAVPSKKVSSGSKNSRRVYLSNCAEREEWLARKGAQNGFRLLSLEERGERKVSGRRKSEGLIFTAMQFGGVLQVTEPRAFWNGVINGIGPEKAYGMGMLMLARI